VEFYSSSVSKELKGEEEMGLRRFSGGSESGMTALRFGSLRAEEGGSAQHGGAAGGAAVPMEAGGGSRWKQEVGANGSRRWEPMPWWAVPGQKVERSGPVSVGVKER
jgi:hypothetical protein